MGERQAKIIRAYFKRHDLRHRVYEHMNQGVKVCPVSGNAVVTSTMRLHPKCGRAQYQAAKRALA